MIRNKSVKSTTTLLSPDRYYFCQPLSVCSLLASVSSFHFLIDSLSKAVSVRIRYLASSVCRRFSQDAPHFRYVGHIQRTEGNQ